jgi:transcriptional regulator
MYVPNIFEENRVEVLQDLIRRNPFGTLVTFNEHGLDADHIPFLLDPSPESFGILNAHVARTNPLWRDTSRHSNVLAIFQGPQAYVSPSWYITKKETGMVVPTWNYAVVHAHGSIEAIDDPAWLHNFLEKLTNAHEANKPTPWKVSDAPDEYIRKQLHAIVGIRLTIKRLEGKWKLSQNRPAHDRAKVIEKFSEQDTESSLSMAAAIREANLEKS